MCKKRITKYLPNSIEINEYKEAISKFGESMFKELVDNHDKGGRSGKSGWVWVQPKQILNEIYYHTGKLQEAIKNFDHDGIKEYSADIANLALMVADIYDPLTDFVADQDGTHPINDTEPTI